MNRKVGKVSWDSPDMKTNNSSNEETKKIPFLTMSGYGKSWKVRVVSEDPLRYYCHFTTDKSGKIVKVNCTLNDDCPVFIEKTKTPCAGNQPDTRYYLKVIDRAAQAKPRDDNPVIKVLDVGKQIINAIGEYISNPEYGHCLNYDITINKGEKGTMPLYTITPARQNTELTTEEQQLIANSEDPDHEDCIDLESRIQPLTGETVQKILGLEETATTVKKDKSTDKPVKKSASDEEFDDIDWDDE